jgi:hypothetical protein
LTRLADSDIGLPPHCSCGNHCMSSLLHHCENPVERIPETDASVAAPAEGAEVVSSQRVEQRLGMTLRALTSTRGQRAIGPPPVRPRKADAVRDAPAKNSGRSSGRPWPLRRSP